MVRCKKTASRSGLGGLDVDVVKEEEEEEVWKFGSARRFITICMGGAWTLSVLAVPTPLGSDEAESRRRENQLCPAVATSVCRLSFREGALADG
jgi:hypothetical protein